MAVNVPSIEFVGTTRIGEKGQLTVPKEYRDELGLERGAPVAVVRIGNGLILIPEQIRFRRLCESISSVLANRGITAADLQASLPQARDRVYARRYPGLAAQPRKRTKPRTKSR
jgi:AbrB family looped-hinge helix DNA binding protein